TVLVITRAQRPRDAVEVREPVAEPVAFRLMLRRVILQVLPEPVGQRVFFVNTGFEDVPELWFPVRHPRIVKPTGIRLVPEADDVNALAVLGHERHRVNDLRLRHVIAQVFAQRLHDHGERAPAVVVLQIPDVFEQEGARPFARDDPGDVEKQRALRGMLKAMRPAERVVLRDPGDAESLTGEPGGQDGVMRYFVRPDPRDVPGRAVTEVGFVSVRRILVPLTGKYATPADTFKRAAKTADAGEQINEGELWFARHLIFGTTTCVQVFRCPAAPGPAPACAASHQRRTAAAFSAPRPFH